MENINKNFKKYQQIILYFIIGGFSASLDFLIFSLLVKMNVQYLVANILSVNCGIISSFILNRKFNFKVKDRVFFRLVVFYLVGFLGLVVSTVILFVLVDKLDYNKVSSKIASIFIIAFMQFFLNKFITFKKSNYEKIC